MILCLDLGTKMGWAYKKESSISSGVENFSSKALESPARRFVRFQQWLEFFLQKERIETIYFEGVRAHKGTAAAHIYGGFVAILLAFCEKNNIEFQSVPVSTIKKFITGKGNASKQEVIDAVIDKMPTTSFLDHNEADALALLLASSEL